MNVYVAACFESRAQLMEGPVKALQAMGFTVVSSWLSRPPEITYESPEDPYDVIARRDLGEIQSAHLLILDTRDTNERGGKEVELGYAFGLGIPVMIVGPARNVFHHAVKRFDGWDAALRFLKGAVCGSSL